MSKYNQTILYENGNNTSKRPRPARVLGPSPASREEVADGCPTVHMHHVVSWAEGSPSSTRDRRRSGSGVNGGSGGSAELPELLRRLAHHAAHLRADLCGGLVDGEPGAVLDALEAKV